MSIRYLTKLYLFTYHTAYMSEAIDFRIFLVSLNENKENPCVCVCDQDWFKELRLAKPKTSVDSVNRNINGKLLYVRWNEEWCKSMEI